MLSLAGCLMLIGYASTRCTTPSAAGHHLQVQPGSGTVFPHHSIGSPGLACWASAPSAVGLPLMMLASTHLTRHISGLASPPRARTAAVVAAVSSCPRVIRSSWPAGIRGTLVLLTLSIFAGRPLRRLPPGHVATDRARELSFSGANCERSRNQQSVRPPTNRFLPVQYTRS